MKLAVTSGIVIFVSTDEFVGRALSALQEMAANGLMVRENVGLERGNLN
jgi:hypothetical protein